MPETQWGDKPIINELDIRIEAVIKKALKYFAEHSLMDREDVENIDKISNYSAFEIMLDVRLIIDNSSLTDAQKVQKIREATKPQPDKEALVLKAVFYTSSKRHRIR